MRINKLLSNFGYCSRKDTRRLIEEERVIINGKVAKPSNDIKEGDIIEILFGNRTLKARIINIAEHVKKEDAKNMYEILEGEEDKE